jgi:lipopolysaccharide biosynthesis regulator YciM
MRADLAAERGSHDLAARLLLRALEDDWNLLLEALPRLIEAVRKSGHDRHLDALVAQVGRQRGGRAADLAQALLLADVPVQGTLADVVESFIAGEPQFAEILALLDGVAGPRSADERRQAVRAVLRHAARGQRYQCASCGFSSQALFWQCPGCREWDGMKPIWMLPPQTAGATRRR